MLPDFPLKLGKIGLISISLDFTRLYVLLKMVFAPRSRFQFFSRSGWLIES